MTDDPRYPNAFDAAYGAGVPLSAVKANEGIAMNHYLTTKYATTSAQPAAIRAAGLAVILTYEEGAAELVGASRAQGQDVGRKILAALQAIPGLPLDGSLAVYVSVDVAVYGNQAVCDQGFLGVRDVLHGKVQTRCYGQGALIDHLAAAHITEGKGWLSASTGYPGWNAADSNVCLVQRVGEYVHSTDLNDITDVHALGAWWPDNSPYGDNMTPDDVRAVVRDELTSALNFLSVGGNKTYGGATGLPAGGGVKVTSGVLSADQITKAVLAALPSGPGATLSKADVEDAVKAVLSTTTLSPGA